MPFSRKTLVLDCTASHVALGVISHAGGRCQLERHWRENLPVEGELEEKWLAHAASALQTLRRRSGQGGRCVLVLPGHLVLTKFLAVPRTTEAQRRKVIQFESEQNLPVALSELVWDSVVSATTSSGVEVLLAASRLRKVDAICRAARKAGFEPVRALPGSLALLAAFRERQPEPRCPAFLIGVGARSVTLLYLDQERFLVRTFAGGVGGLIPGEPVASVEEVARHLTQEAVRSLRYYRHRYGLPEPERIYLAGEAARVAGLVEPVSSHLARRVDVLDPFTCRSHQGLPETDPASLELVGAAIAHTREDSAAVNLLPPQFGQQRAVRHRRTLVAAAACSVALIASLIWIGIHPRKSAGRAITPSAVASHRVDAPVAMAAPAPAPVVVESEDATPEEPDSPQAELIAVRAEPYRLQLAGYLGEPDNYRAVLVTPGEPNPVVAGQGLRLASLGVEVRRIELRKVAMAQGKNDSDFEVAAFATIHDERLGEDIVLDSRGPKFGALQAWFRLPAQGAEPRALREGDEFAEAGVTYRIDRIETDPPQAVVVRELDGDPDWEGTVLRQVPDSTGGSASFANAVGPTGGQ